MVRAGVSAPTDCTSQGQLGWFFNPLLPDVVMLCPAVCSNPPGIGVRIGYGCH